jgi:hypothetical protein
MTDLDTKTQRRSRGRPALRTENETRAALIEAARTEFLEEGYTGTSIEAHNLQDDFQQGGALSPRDSGCD